MALIVDKYSNESNRTQFQIDQTASIQSIQIETFEEAKVRLRETIEDMEIGTNRLDITTKIVFQSMKEEFQMQKL